VEHALVDQRPVGHLGVPAGALGVGEPQQRLRARERRVEIAGGPGHRLAELWSNYLACAISFLAIGVLWINHHTMMRRLSAADHCVLVPNLLLLLCSVAMPFTSSLIAGYLDDPDGGHLAAAGRRHRGSGGGRRVGGSTVTVAALGEW